MTTEYIYRSEGDNQPSIQAAIDAIGSQGGEIVLTGGAGPLTPWRLDRPIQQDKNRVVLRGQRPYQDYLSAGAYFHPLITGCRPRNVDHDHWVDANPYLDATAGQRHAIRTLNTARLTFQGTPLDCGPPGGYPSVDALTVSMGFVAHNQSTDGAVPLFGMFAPIGLPSPFYLSSKAGLFSYFDFATTATDRIRLRLLWVPTVGVYYDFDFQINLMTGEAQAWANGQWITCTTDGVAFAGQRLADNLAHSPGGIFAVTKDAYTWGEFEGVSPRDATVTGFKVSRAAVYLPTPTQQRADGAPITSRNRYFDVTPDTVFLLPLDEVPADRLVKWQMPHLPGVGTNHGFGLLLRPADRETGAAIVAGCCYEDLWLRCYSPYGGAILTGSAHDTEYTRAQFTGGAFAFHGMNTLSSYEHVFHHCILENGAQANFRAANMIVHRYNCVSRVYGKWADNVAGCSLIVRGGGYDGDGSNEGVIRFQDGEYGAGLDVENTYFDFEGEHLPKQSYIDMDVQRSVPTSFLRVSQVGFAGVRPGKTRIVLRSRGVSADKGYATLDNCQYWGHHGAGLVCQAGPVSSWGVESLKTRPPGVPLVIDAAGGTIEE